MKEEYLTPLEVAEQMKVHRRTVYRWIEKGTLKAKKPVDGSRLVRIKKDQLCNLQAR